MLVNVGFLSLYTLANFLFFNYLYILLRLFTTFSSKKNKKNKRVIKKYIK